MLFKMLVGGILKGRSLWTCANISEFFSEDLKISQEMFEIGYNELLKEENSLPICLSSCRVLGKYMEKIDLNQPDFSEPLKRIIVKLVELIPKTNSETIHIPLETIIKFHKVLSIPFNFHRQMRA